MSCPYPNIPNRLHQEDRTVIEVFGNNERLFRRIEPNKVFAFSADLMTVSINREGDLDAEYETPLSLPLDANLFVRDGVVIQDTKDIAILSIEKCPDLPHGFEIPIDIDTSNLDNPIDSIRAIIKHTPLNCNFSHSDVDFFVNGHLMEDFDIYSQALGKKNKTMHRVRQIVRDELHKIQIARVDHQGNSVDNK